MMCWSQVFQRAVVFLLDRSGSMYGKPIEDARQALFFALDSLKPEDSFNIVAFDHELTLFSSQMERATPNAIGWAREWAMTNCTARGGTDILGPLQQVHCVLWCWCNSLKCCPQYLRFHLSFLWLSLTFASMCRHLISLKISHGQFHMFFWSQTALLAMSKISALQCNHVLLHLVWGHLVFPPLE